MTDSPTGVLLINLGTPESPTPQSIRSHLRRSLSDPFVDFGPPRPIWWLIRNFFILPLRPYRSARKYSSIWMQAGSPLSVHTQAQVAALTKRLGPTFRVEAGYRYSNPSIAWSLRRLVDAGCRRVVALPLFPQESSAGMGSSVRELRSLVAQWAGEALAIDVVAPYFDHPTYIAAVSDLVNETRTRHPQEHIVFSYHGVPRAFIERGEPYERQCEATSAALASHLSLESHQWTHAYQSQFGGGDWLGPSTADVLNRLAEARKRPVVVFPGFAADCLETLEEIGIRGVASFKGHGGEAITLAPCVNDSASWINAMAEMVLSRD